MVTREELLQCSISNWYPQFDKHTFMTVLVPLPEDFVAWLLEDGVFLPATTSAFPTRNKQDAFTDSDYKDWSSEEDDNEDDGQGIAGAAATAPSEFFPDLIAAISSAIGHLGGAVLPKLTWSVPKDAAWMAVGNSLRCCTPDEVFLLLKSSDRAAHDLEDALANCSSSSDTSQNDDDDDVHHQHVLALRKWYDLKPGREFRCFVVDSILVGISQRDVSRKYEELDAELSSIQRRIERFYEDVVVQSSTFALKNFTFDCYVPSSVGAAVRLVDFNPAGGTTAPLLFEWDELLSSPPEQQGCEETENNSEESEEIETVVLQKGVVDFRIIREDVALRPDTALYGVPYDFVDMSEGSALTALMEQAQKGNSV